MQHKWEDKIKRIHREACEILLENNWPTTSSEILSIERDAENHLVSHALRVVINVEKLFEEVAQGKVDRALDNILNICENYENIWILRDIPETDNKLMVTREIINKMRKGFRRFGWQSSGGTQNATPESEIKDWKAQYEKLLETNSGLSKRSAAAIIDPSKIETIRKKI